MIEFTKEELMALNGLLGMKVNLSGTADDILATAALIKSAQDKVGAALGIAVPPRIVDKPPATGCV